MNRSLEIIVSDLNALTADDFDYRKSPMMGVERIYAICDEVQGLAVPSTAFPEFFRLIERLSECDLGTPGSLVHTMEKQIGSYEDLLTESVLRKPTDLTIWMVNRILNGKTKDRDKWMKLLATAANNPTVSSLVREQAEHFIEFQRKK